ncbi:MAG: hypothetical protein LQ351_007657 [Letrouitia transgressa]|nr:MAG: hypothetical protein LQ351_007657 [Letrouitia transgressa]
METDFEAFRIRHIKCDEERPACLNCQSTGRTCDGYEQKASASGRKPHELSLAKNPSLEIANTELERHGLDYFHLAVGQELVKTLNLAASHQLILQASHSHDAVKHAIVALGLLGERLTKNRLLTCGHFEKEPAYEYAQVQYQKALINLRGSLGQEQLPPVEIVLTSCFLFTLIEFFQGNDVGSLTHLRSGMNILQRCYGITTGERPSMNNGLPGQDLMINEFIRIFSLMDVHATRFLNVPDSQSPRGMSVDVTPDHDFDHFDTLQDAADSLSCQITRIQFLRHSVLTAVSASSSQDNWAEKERLLLRLKRWPIAMGSLSNRLRGTAEEARCVGIMKMNYLSTLVILSTFLHPNPDEGLALFTPAFAQILVLAKGLLRPASPVNRLDILEAILILSREDSIEKMTLFSFFSGTIQPLFFTATKCRDHFMCIEAIELLREEPWREGAWSSAALARIATRKLELRMQAERPTCSQLPQMIGCPKYLMSIGIHPL